MKSRVFVSILMFALAALACNLPSAGGDAAPVVEEQTPTPQAALPLPSSTPTPEPPTATLTPLPSETPTITPTPTPSNPVVSPAKDPVNCRFGPGTEYAVVGALLVAEVGNIQGKSAGGDWWFIQTPKGANCWVAGSVVIASGNLAIVNVLAAPQALVTDVTLAVKPTTLVVPGCVFPYSPVELKGSITTNGPATVKWRWETSQGDVSATSSLEFTSFGTKTIEDVYKVGAKGDYWIKLVVLGPNNDMAQATYEVVCE